MTTSSPRACRRIASLNMLKVLPTPGAYPRKSLNTPPFFLGSASSNHCSGVLVIAAIVVEQIQNVECGRERPHSLLPKISYNRRVNQARLKSAMRYAATAVAVLFLVVLYHVVIKVNPTTVALSFLIGVLIVSANWGLRPAVFMALVATLAFNYYFLPPVGTLTIADPQNWVALLAFLVTAIIASQLAERARREAQRANERRHEAERLYRFSQQLLSSDNVIELLNAIPRYIVDSFGVKAAAIVLPNRPDVSGSSPPFHGLEPPDLKLVCMGGEPMTNPEKHMVVIPLRMGL